MERARELGAGLIVTVDCGTTSAEAIALAQSQRIDVIVTDHHLPGSDFPADTIQVNPKAPGCDYPFADLCGAGIAFKLACGVLERLGKRIPREQLLRIACLGTIADVVPLRGENRTIAAIGLQALGETRSAGLKALFEVAGVRPPLRADDVGFRIGPRINAAGRLDSPDQALELLLSRDAERAKQLAEELDRWNGLRQEEELRVVEEATELFGALDPLPGLLIGSSPDWHRGVVGIAAGRLASRYHRPVLLLAEESDSATGSGRSIPGVHLHAFLDRWRDRMLRFGGHEFAVGLTVSMEQLAGLREEWREQAEWPAEVLTRRRQYEADLRPAQFSDELYDRLRVLAPHGAGNPQPLVRVGPLRLMSEPREFGKGHLRAIAEGAGEPGRVSLLGWRFKERQSDLGGRFDALGRIDWDSYLGVPVLELVDCRPSSTGETTEGRPMSNVTD